MIGSWLRIQKIGFHFFGVVFNINTTSMSDTTAVKFELKSICVFCGSRAGSKPDYAEGAKALANEMLKRKIGLVYGGGNIGLMGIVSSSIAEGGGEVLGIIPKSLAPREVSGTMIGKGIIVETMHDRKFMMYKQADGFIAIPGGYGTLDELMEIITWSQLGIHSKPIGILNIAGYFDPLLEWVKKATDDGFVSEDHKKIWIVSSDPVDLLNKFEAFVPPAPLFNWDIKV